MKLLKFNGLTNRLATINEALRVQKLVEKILNLTWPFRIKKILVPIGN